MLRMSYAHVWTLCFLMLSVDAMGAAVDGPYLQAARPTGISDPYPGYKSWISNSVTTVRGLIRVQGHETGTVMYNDFDFWRNAGSAAAQGYRSLAKRLDFALFMVPKYNLNNDHAGQVAEYWSKLTQLANTAGHPEIQYSSMIYTGLSAGAWHTAWAAAVNPTRTMVFVQIAGGNDSMNTVAWRAVPGLKWLA